MNEMSTEEPTTTVFVVDDDASVRDSVVAALRRLNVEVECFASAEDFLQLWGGPRPGCLVLDVRMTGMSGIELQQQLNADQDYLSIVLVTGHATVRLSVDAMKRGAIDVLEKPYSPDELRRIVTAGLGHSARSWQRQQCRADFESKRATLSPREREVYGLLLKGMENKQIAVALAISPSTVEKHRLAVVRKMETDNITQLFGQKFEATGTIHDTSVEVNTIDPSKNESP